MTIRLPFPRRSGAATLIFTALGAGLVLSAVPAQAQRATRTGALDCGVSGGVGFVITSARALNCVFRPTRGPAERYVGTIRRFGLDLGVTGPGQMRWAVFTAERGPQRGALAGEYVGASGEITAGAGIGANALVGGFRRSISLQPLSVSAQTGVSLAAGVGAMQLEAAGPVRRRR